MKNSNAGVTVSHEEQRNSTMQKIIPELPTKDCRRIYYIILHSQDSKLVQITIGCGICHINTKINVEYK
jgi:hypothetical protein